MGDKSVKRISFLKFILAIGLSTTLAYAQGGLQGLTPSGQGQGSSGSDITIIGGYSDQYLTAPTKSGGGEKATGLNFYLITESPTYYFNMLNALLFDNYLNNLMGKNTASTASTQNPLDPQSSLTAKGVSSLLTATPTNNLLVTAKAMAQYLPITDPNQLVNFENDKVNQAQSTGGNQSGDKNNINSLNVGALIDPIQYDTDKFNLAKTAKDFIQYASSQFNPLPIIDFGTGDKLTRALRTASVQQYLLMIRQMIANYSTGMNNLYFLYNERIPKQTTELLGSESSNTTKDTLPQTLQTTASRLSLEKWMATYRVTNYKYKCKICDKESTWNDAMENATPASLQRETLHLLAEIRYELFQQRMLQERLLATESIAQMQNANNQQIKLQQVERMICSDSTLGAGCPPAPTIPTQ